MVWDAMIATAWFAKANYPDTVSALRRFVMSCPSAAVPCLVNCLQCIFPTWNSSNSLVITTFAVLSHERYLIQDGGRAALSTLFVAVLSSKQEEGMSCSVASGWFQICDICLTLIGQMQW